MPPEREESTLVAPTPEAIEACKTTALEMWRRRAAERREPEPYDLSSSCKFTTQFAKLIFGGEIRGNHDHFHLRCPCGVIVDLNADARDVMDIREQGRDPLLHDRRLMRSRDVRESLASCLPRAVRWALEHRAPTCG
jgi:hypothetical protein